MNDSDFSLGDQQTTRKLATRNNDAAALAAIVSFVNNPVVTGAVVPPEAKREIADVFNSAKVKPYVENNLMPDPVFSTPSTAEDTSPITSTSPPTSVHTQARLQRKIFFTGRLCAGKDHTAAAIGATVLGFADPVYSLAEYLFGVKVGPNEGKGIPGMRRFLQTVGQWGRNEINEQYPLTAERSMFCLMIRSLANQNILSQGVDWGMFGLTKDLWVDGLLKRADSLPPNTQIAITNCRFTNEYNRLLASGYQHWHITCSPQSWINRIAKKKLTPESPEVKDMSEKLAADLNNSLTRKLSEHRSGNKLQVVWSDDLVPPPGNRVYTLQQFKSLATQL